MPDDVAAGAAGTEGNEGGGASATEPKWFETIWDKERPGAFVPKYQENLPPEMDEYKSMLANYPDFPTMAKSIKDLTTQVRNGKGLKPLTPESTPDEVTAYRKALGIPDAPYEFAKPEKLPDGVEWRDDRMKTFGKWAQEQNLTQKQAENAKDLYLQFIAEDFGTRAAAEKEALDKHLAAEKEQIRTEFGGKLDGVVLNAKRIALKYDMPADLLDPGSQRFVGVTMLRVFSDMAKAIGESRLPSEAAVQNTDPLRQAKAMREKGHTDYDALKRGDKTAMDKYFGLLKIAKEQGLIPAA